MQSTLNGKMTFFQVIQAYSLGSPDIDLEYANRTSCVHKTYSACVNSVNYLTLDRILTKLVRGVFCYFELWSSLVIIGCIGD